MEQLKQYFCRYEMVCDAPENEKLELFSMPEFYDVASEMESEKAHVHTFYEIVWFKDDGGFHHVDFNDYPVKANTLFFIAPGQVHAFDSNHKHKGYVLKICREMLYEMPGDNLTYMKYNIFNSDTLPLHHISGKDAEMLQKIFDDIADELRRGQSIGHKEYLRSLVKLLVITIERGCADGDHRMMNITKTADRTFLAFRQQLEKHYKQYHTVKQYASLLNVSTKTLTNYVTENSPNSPLELINNRIILEAKRLLAYSNMTAKEIGYNLGFEDPSYFVKFFKRMVGVSPSEYRDNL